MQLDVFAPHRLHDHLFQLHLLELAFGEILRLEGLNERVAVAAEIGADDIVHPFLNEMVRNLVIFLLERLKDQLAINQVLERCLARFLHFLD